MAPRRVPVVPALVLLLLWSAAVVAAQDADSGAERISTDQRPPMLGMDAFLVIAGVIAVVLAVAAVLVHYAIERRAAANVGRLSSDEAEAERVAALVAGETPDGSRTAAPRYW